MPRESQRRDRRVRRTRKPALAGRSRALRLEPLEDRQMLSGDSLDIGSLTEWNPNASGISVPSDWYDPRTDEYIVDDFGNIIYIDPAPDLGSLTTVGDNSEAGGGAGTVDAAALHSKPGATKIIHLDFNGHTTTGTAWNSAFTEDEEIPTPGSGISDPDIISIWERVSEDFSPFDVDVTTEDQLESSLMKTGPGDVKWGIRVVIGENVAIDKGGEEPEPWFPDDVGGVAYLYSFDASIDVPVFVFPENLGFSVKAVAEAASHEVGHSLGLLHDGTDETEITYYPGHGDGATGWAPIMGVGYGKELVTWSKGEYFDANNFENDLFIITTANGFGYRFDDHGDSSSIATPLDIDTGVVTPMEGIITTRTDVDFFSFTTGGGLIDLDFDPFVNSPNLDILATLYDSDGLVLAVDNPVDALNANISLILEPGDYFLEIDGTGKGTTTTGYSDYASLGRYTIAGTVVAPNEDSYEENDTRLTASNPSDFIAGSPWNGMWLSGINGLGVLADDDWYSIDVQSNLRRVRIDAQYTQDDGNIDLGLYNASGSLLTGSNGAIGYEYIDYVVPTNGTYYIKAFGDNAENTYDLWWDGFGLVDSVAPIAVLDAPDLWVGGDTVHTIEVTYSDNIAVDISTLGNADLTITRSGGGSVGSITFQSVDIAVNGRERTATYLVAAPGGVWDVTDDDTYFIQMQPNEVLDASGIAVPALTLGTLTVDIAGSDGQHVWSDYLGGSQAERGFATAVDSVGDVFLTGQSWSSGWGIDGADQTHDGEGDIFVAKASRLGEPLWATYLGGTDWDYGYAVAVDTAGNLFVAGATASVGWATGGFDTSQNGGADGWIAKLSPTGETLWSTYFGGNNDDSIEALVLDDAGNIYVTGTTDSAGWIAGGFDTTFNGGTDAFVAKLTSDGQLDWSTYIGGNSFDSAFDIAVDANGDTFLAGQTLSENWVAGGFDTVYDLEDGFAAKISSDGIMQWSTYLGGLGTDYAYGIVVDDAGNAYVAGETASDGWVSGGFDTTYGGGRDAFVLGLSPLGSHLWSTYLGGDAWDNATDIALDESGKLLLTGSTWSPEDPADGWYADKFDTTYNGGGDGFVAALTVAGERDWLSFFGGDTVDYAESIALDPVGNILITGITDSSDSSEYWTSGEFKTTYAGLGDTFLLKVAHPGGSTNAPVPGDFNSDGAVDGNDFLAWQTGFGISSGATLADGDADGDGDVDGNDFLIWQSNFGTGSGAAANGILTGRDALAKDRVFARRSVPQRTTGANRVEQPIDTLRLVRQLRYGYKDRAGVPTEDSIGHRPVRRSEIAQKDAAFEQFHIKELRSARFRGRLRR